MDPKYPEAAQICKCKHKDSQITVDKQKYVLNEKAFSKANIFKKK